jgi:hypothetical protein
MIGLQESTKCARIVKVCQWEVYVPLNKAPDGTLGFYHAFHFSLLNWNLNFSTPQNLLTSVINL